MKKRIILTIILTLMTAAVLAVCLSGCDLSYEKFNMASPSMEPAIYPGETVYIDTKFSVDDIKPGDIIAYKRSYSDNYIPPERGGKNYELIIHRLVKIENGYLYLKGDNNANEDEPTPINTYYGKVVKIKTKDGKTIEP